ncbi:MAG: bifunctional 5,10-methylenetetrahydrofolate dehydrogenase/5,10-methenyltetrahydrofolate cyclohydrolase [Eubacteriales bacterium]|nr:bifunctional 5,10-methylenetetrahydrofolate dehydrogenase/5,10-methenyltetrahydrofolate cyclohydrolase [Eubacteriales bacterium]
MAEILKGLPVGQALDEKTKETVERLKERGILPSLTIIRLGERESDDAYLRGIHKKSEKTGVNVNVLMLPEDISEEDYLREVKRVSDDPAVHGVIMMRPLPKRISFNKARALLDYRKDVDGCTDGSLAGVFADMGHGFPPCTAAAAMRVIDYYNIDVAGKLVCIIGRSLVIGRPIAMMLLQMDATPVICHTKTADVKALCKKADIVVACCGRPELIGKEYLSEGQTVIDVGVSWNEEKQKMTGDVNDEEALAIVGALTPVPGGIGQVTTSVLMSHVAEAAQKLNGETT